VTSVAETGTRVYSESLHNPIASIIAPPFFSPSQAISVNSVATRRSTIERTSFAFRFLPRYRNRRRPPPLSLPPSLPPAKRAPSTCSPSRSRTNDPRRVREMFTGACNRHALSAQRVVPFDPLLALPLTPGDRVRRASIPKLCIGATLRRGWQADNAQMFAPG